MTNPIEITDTDLENVKGGAADPEWRYVPVRRFAAASTGASEFVLPEVDDEVVVGFAAADPKSKG